MKNMTSEKNFAAFVGIDWAEQEHTYSLAVAGSNKIERGRLQHTPEALHHWAEQLARRFAGRPVAILLEQKRGALACALQEHPFITLFPINPLTSAKLRQAFFPSGAKSDPLDSDLLLDILRHHRDRLRPFQLDEVQTRLLERLTQDRRGAVDQRKSCVQQITAALKEYFPLALEVLGKLDCNLAARFLLKWSSLEDLQAAQPHLVRKFFHGNNGRFQIEKRLQRIKQAQPLTTDSAIIESGRRKVQMLARLILTLNESIADYQKRIDTLFERHPDRHIFESFPGAGAALAPRLVAAFGMDRSAFAGPVSVQNRSGIAPIRVSSGKTALEKMRVVCPKFLRQTFHEFAATSVRYCSWARTYYQAKAAVGKKHHTIIRALAFKWIRIMWACWQNQESYDEKRYLRALRKSHSPFAATPKIA